MYNLTVNKICEIKCFDIFIFTTWIWNLKTFIINFTNLKALTFFITYREVNEISVGEFFLYRHIHAFGVRLQLNPKTFIAY